MGLCEILFIICDMHIHRTNLLCVHWIWNERHAVICWVYDLKFHRFDAKLTFCSEILSLKKTVAILCGTAQRQLDTRTRAAGWILSGEDYIMRSMFEWASITFVPASGKFFGMCTCEHYIILYELLQEIYINSIYMMNLQILSLYVLINPWIHFLLKSFSCAVYLMSYCLAGCGEWIWCREWILYWRLYLH